MAGLAASLFAIGTYLLMQRKLSRIIVGLGLLSHGANVLFVNAGRRGIPALIGAGNPDDFADPVPQALVLTAIVIALGTTAFLLAMAHRSWQLNGNDDVQDDVEDATVRRLAAADEASDSHDLATGGADDDALTEEGA